KAIKTNDKAAMIKTRAAMIQMLGKLAPEVDKCARLDAPNRVTWINISKYCTTGKLLADAANKAMEEYAKVKPGAEEEKQRAKFTALIDESTDTLNKIVAAVNPLIGNF